MISIHPNAVKAAEATEAAGAQGQFWGMYDLLYTRQGEWGGLDEDQLVDQLISYAEELDLDVERFEQELTDDVYEPKVMESYNVATAMGLSGTPTFIVNGLLMPFEFVQNLGLDYAVEVFVSLAEMADEQYTALPEMVIDQDTQYIAVFETSQGEFVVELHPEWAPTNVNNFVRLARDGWYDNTTFNLVIPDVVAQGGDPSGTGYGHPGYYCGNEVAPGLSFDAPGIVGLSTIVSGMNGAQPFITLGSLPHIDGQYTMIGRVIEGMDVVQSLNAREPGSGVPPGDTIESVTIEER